MAENNSIFISPSAAGNKAHILAGSAVDEFFVLPEHQTTAGSEVENAFVPPEHETASDAPTTPSSTAPGASDRQIPPLMETTTGKRYWSKQEHQLFLRGLAAGTSARDPQSTLFTATPTSRYDEIASFVGSRTATQVRSHYQKWVHRVQTETAQLLEKRKLTAQKQDGSPNGRKFELWMTRLLVVAKDQEAGLSESGRQRRSNTDDNP